MDVSGARGNGDYSTLSLNVHTGDDQFQFIAYKVGMLIDTMGLRGDAKTGRHGNGK
jgi:hypothetical protein